MLLSSLIAPMMISTWGCAEKGLGGDRKKFASKLTLTCNKLWTHTYRASSGFLERHVGRCGGSAVREKASKCGTCIGLYNFVDGIVTLAVVLRFICRVSQKWSRSGSICHRSNLKDTKHSTSHCSSLRSLQIKTFLSLKTQSVLIDLGLVTELIDRN